MIKNFISFFFCFSFLLSGCSLSSKFNNPEDQFAFIKQEYKIVLCHLSSGKCIQTDVEGSSSGVLIKNSKTKDKSYFLTAGHVCDDDIGNRDSRFLVIPLDLKFEIEQRQSKKALEGKVFSVDQEHDMCLLETELVKNGNPISLARKSPKINDKVINYAAPRGVWNKGMQVIFEGKFIGYHNINDEKENDLEAVYTLSADFGSSGSPIINKYGNIVGILTKVVPNSFEIAYGPTHNQLKEFLSTNLQGI